MHLFKGVLECALHPDNFAHRIVPETTLSCREKIWIILSCKCYVMGVAGVAQAGGVADTTHVIGGVSMPYYIYKIFDFPVIRLEKIEQHDVYRAAADRARTLRRELALSEQCKVKMIFAENELQAEDLLSQVREPAPELGDD